VREGFEEMAPASPEVAHDEVLLSIHSSVRNARCVGAAMELMVSSQLSSVLPVGNPAALRRCPVDWRAAYGGETRGARRDERGRQR
jgi:hypothetical protein